MEDIIAYFNDRELPGISHLDYETNTSHPGFFGKITFLDLPDESGCLLLQKFKDGLMVGEFGQLKIVRQVGEYTSIVYLDKSIFFDAFIREFDAEKSTSSYSYEFDEANFGWNTQSALDFTYSTTSGTVPVFIGNPGVISAPYEEAVAFGSRESHGEASISGGISG